MLQPIDAGIGSILKCLMAQVQDEWLDDEDNLLAWEGDPESTQKLDTKSRRILITKWAGEAWERLTSMEHYRDTIWKCFQKTGGLMTVDGTDDEKICPVAGLKNYTFSNITEINNEEKEDETPILNNHQFEDIHSDDESMSEVILEGEEFELMDEASGDIASHEQRNTALHIDIEQQLKDDDEEESFQMAIESALMLTVPWGIDYNMSSLIPRLPAYALVCSNNQWDLVKIEKKNADNSYRYKLDTSWTYGTHFFDNAHRGKANPHPNRWVLLKKSSCT